MPIIQYSKYCKENASNNKVIIKSPLRFLRFENKSYFVTLHVAFCYILLFFFNEYLAIKWKDQ